MAAQGHIPDRQKHSKRGHGKGNGGFWSTEGSEGHTEVGRDTFKDNKPQSQWLKQTQIKTLTEEAAEL